VRDPTDAARRAGEDHTLKKKEDAALVKYAKSAKYEMYAKHADPPSCLSSPPSLSQY
jgi:hypothetical protein